MFRLITLFSLVDIIMEEGIDISKQYGFTHQLSHDEKMHVVLNKEQQDQVFRSVHDISEELIRRYILEIIISHLQKSLLRNTFFCQHSAIFLIIHFCASTKFENCKIEQLFVRTLHDGLHDKSASIFTGMKKYSKYPLLLTLYTAKQEGGGNFTSIYQFSLSLLNYLNRLKYEVFNRAIQQFALRLIDRNKRNVSIKMYLIQHQESFYPT